MYQSPKFKSSLYACHTCIEAITVCVCVCVCVCVADKLSPLNSPLQCGWLKITCHLLNSPLQCGWLKITCHLLNSPLQCGWLKITSPFELSTSVWLANDNFSPQYYAAIVNWVTCEALGSSTCMQIECVITYHAMNTASCHIHTEIYSTHHTHSHTVHVSTVYIHFHVDFLGKVHKFVYPVWRLSLG